MKPEEIRRRLGALRSDRKTVEQTWQSVEQLVVPFRGQFFRDQSSEHEIDFRNTQLYDSTAIVACDGLSAAMQGSLTSPATKWFGLQFNIMELNKKIAPRAWLEECENIMFDTLQQSNFNIESSEFYIDITSFGTAFMSEEPLGEGQSFRGLDFQAVPVREAFFETDHKDQVKRFYRRLQWTPVQIIDKFGKENVPDSIIEKANNATQERLTVIFCIYERDNVRPTDGVMEPRARPFGFKYILQNDGEELGPEGGYYEQPVFCGRWRKVSGSQWGHSPAFIAMPDIHNINELIESTLEAAGKVIDPATLTTQRGVFGDLDLRRGGVTVVKNIGDIAPFDPGARFDVAQFVYEMFQRNIREVFRVDQLQLKESPAMTATEVQVRYELMQRLLGPTLGRLQNDFLDPLIQRTFNILSREGKLPPPPPELDQYDAEYRIEYTGPLPRAQKMDTVRSMQEYLVLLGEMAPVFPELLDNVDPDEFAHVTASMMSIPARILRSQEQVEDLRAERADKQAQAEAAALAQAEGDAMQSQGKGAQAIAQAESGMPVQ